MPLVDLNFLLTVYLRERALDWIFVILTQQEMSLVYSPTRNSFWWVSRLMEGIMTMMVTMTGVMIPKPSCTNLWKHYCTRTPRENPTILPYPPNYDRISECFNCRSPSDYNQVSEGWQVESTATLTRLCYVQKLLSSSTRHVHVYRKSFASLNWKT